MKKIEKPTFLKKTGAFIVMSIEFVTALISFLIPDISKKAILGIPLNWLIFIIMTLVVVTVSILNYFHRFNDFYKEYENQFNEFERTQKNNEALIPQYQKKQEEINKLKKFLELYDYSFNNVLNRVQQGACNVSDKEQDYLKKVYEMLLSDKNYIYKNKGDL